MGDDIIRTRRLDLVAMTPAFIEASLRRDRLGAGHLLGASVPKDWPDANAWLARRLDELRQDPSLLQWLGRAMRLRDEHRMVGNIGFHTRPAPAYLEVLAPGAVEFGYTVFAEDRRRGYAREACEGLMDWARREHGVTRFVVSISPMNVASLALAHGLGFRRIGSHVDPEDGPEDLFERLAVG